MSEDKCILTTKDFTILEVMLDRCLGRDDPLAPLLRRKLNAAQVVFRDDVPADVATLSSRVTFSVNEREADTRVISHELMTASVGLFLPIGNPRGLALLGLQEGQVFCLRGGDGAEERVLLQKVAYQPEAARRERQAIERLAAAPRRPALRVIAGSRAYQPQAAAVPVPAGDDDPGPSAA